MCSYTQARFQNSTSPTHMCRPCTTTHRPGFKTALHLFICAGPVQPVSKQHFTYSSVQALCNLHQNSTPVSKQHFTYTSVQALCNLLKPPTPEAAAAAAAEARAAQQLSMYIEPPTPLAPVDVATLPAIVTAQLWVCNGMALKECAMTRLERLLFFYHCLVTTQL